jgi:hypothetical protein
VPPYTSLPADAQATAANNGGTLNINAFAYGQATTGGVTYTENAASEESAWVGTSSQPAAPTGYTPAAAQVMTLVPPGPDDSAVDTPANQATTWSSQNISGATDSNGAAISNSASESENASPPTDSAGYQTLGTDTSYNPYIAADGTNLASVPVSAVPAAQGCGPDGHKVLSSWTSRVKAAEQHSGWDNSGNVTLGFGGQITIGTLFSANGGDWSISGTNGFTYGSSITATTAKSGPNASHFVWLVMNFEHQKRKHHCWNVNTGLDTSVWYTYWRGATGIHAFSYPNTSSNLYAGQQNIYSTFDGPNGMTNQKNTHPSYITAWVRGEQACLGTYKGAYYGAGVSIAGIGVSTQVTYDTTTSQCIYEGNGTKHTHWIWSHYGNPQDLNGNGLALHTLYSS